MRATGDYQDCYVAFLDVLGFRQLVERSVNHPALLRQISGITTLAATPKSGVKQTSLGPCPMQIRAFSDSIVVFTPTAHANGTVCNPLAQLCFVVRYLHDRILDLDACIRGGITVGKMYWHPSWSDVESKPRRGSRGAQSITFGPGMIAAYKLENQTGSPPRVLVSDTIQNIATTQQTDQEVVWELEPNRWLVEPAALPQVRSTASMSHRHFDALVRAARWGAVAPFVDPDDDKGIRPASSIVAPFHSAVQIEDFQLVPLAWLRALMVVTPTW